MEQRIEAEEMIYTDSITAVLGHITTWHERQVALLKHLLSTPVGTSVTIGEADEAETIVLEGYPHKAFILGLEVALMQFKELPFQVEYEEEEDEEQPSH
jgi:hypothetical protein